MSSVPHVDYITGWLGWLTTMSSTPGGRAKKALTPNAVPARVSTVFAGTRCALTAARRRPRPQRSRPRPPGCLTRGNGTARHEPSAAAPEIPRLRWRRGAVNNRHHTSHSRTPRPSPPAGHQPRVNAGWRTCGDRVEAVQPRYQLAGLRAYPRDQGRPRCLIRQHLALSRAAPERLSLPGFPWA